VKKYLLTSTAFSGEVEFTFNDLGMLSSFDASRADLSAKQQEWILKAMPDKLSDVQRVLGDSKTATLTEVKETVTFEQFWNRYDEKLRSSKKKTELRWNRMKETDQIKAFKYIQRYEQSIPMGVCKKYAETYLNAEQWNN
jgi:hypothetical protein